MALVKCKECDAVISDSVKACPLCGHKKKEGNGCVNTFLAVGFLIYLGMKFFGGVDESTSRRMPQTETINSIAISANHLINAYDENEVAADSKFRGEWLLINGVVTDITKNFTDDVEIHLGGNGLISVIAELNESEINKAANLNKGQQISVLCKGRGSVLSSPYVSNCTIK